MKVCVDSEICSGFGICTGIIPEVFEIVDDGYAIVLTSDVSPEDEDLVRRAADQCPANAISITDD